MLGNMHTVEKKREGWNKYKLRENDREEERGKKVKKIGSKWKI